VETALVVVVVVVDRGVVLRIGWPREERRILLLLLLQGWRLRRQGVQRLEEALTDLLLPLFALALFLLLEFLYHGQLGISLYPQA
jgi:hypothetical protein